VRIEPSRLAALTGATWVDVIKVDATGAA